MKRSFLYFFLLSAIMLFSMQNASARLGETLRETNQRYGSPQDNSKNPILQGAVNVSYLYQGYIYAKLKRALGDNSESPNLGNIIDFNAIKKEWRRRELNPRP
jgi:hypothetical protein